MLNCHSSFPVAPARAYTLLSLLPMYTLFDNDTYGDDTIGPPVLYAHFNTPVKPSIADQFDGQQQVMQGVGW